MKYKGEMRNLTVREKGIRNKCLAVFVMTLRGFIWISVMYLNAATERDTFKTKATSATVDLFITRAALDSTKELNFSLSTEVGRYEITLEYLKEVDSIAYKKFKKFLDHETE